MTPLYAMALLIMLHKVYVSFITGREEYLSVYLMYFVNGIRFG